MKTCLFVMALLAQTSALKIHQDDDGLSVEQAQMDNATVSLLPNKLVAEADQRRAEKKATEMAQKPAVKKLSIPMTQLGTNKEIISPPRDTRFKNLPLSTKGSKIVDSKGNMVRLACVNWYGASMKRSAVNGLDEVDLDKLSQMIADQGFNCVRLPFSLELVYSNPTVDDEAVSANPHLKGLTAIELFDKTVESITNAGVAVILNNHVNDAIWCCYGTDGNGIWHNENYNTQQWIDAVVGMSARYKSNPLVIGNDLRNEIRNDDRNNLKFGNNALAWGTGDVDKDWKQAATECGNALHEQAPDQLIIVEGLLYAVLFDELLTDPIKLEAPNKLVYSFHRYAFQGHVNYTVYEKGAEDLHKIVSFLLDEGHDYTAPLWLGEFGQNAEKGETALADDYWAFIIRWLKENPSVGFAYWPWNGYKDTQQPAGYELMNPDYVTVRHDWKLRDLQSVQGIENA